MSISENIRTFTPGMTFWSKRHHKTTYGPDQETLTIGNPVTTGTAGERKRSYRVHYNGPRNKEPWLLSGSYNLVTEGNLRYATVPFVPKMGSPLKQKINGGVGRINPDTGEIEIEY